MPAVLTTGSTVQCSHQAPVTLKASKSKLKAAGNPVLVASDLTGATIVGCPNTGPGLKPCTTTQSPVAGVATKLSVGGQPVLLETATGATDGNPPATWSVKTAGQSVLKAS